MSSPGSKPCWAPSRKSLRQAADIRRRASLSCSAMAAFMAENSGCSRMPICATAGWTSASFPGSTGSPWPAALRACCCAVRCPPRRLRHFRRSPSRSPAPPRLRSSWMANSSATCRPPSRWNALACALLCHNTFPGASACVRLLECAYRGANGLSWRPFFPGPCCVLPAPAQTLSNSKLSAHLINGYTVGSSNIVSGKPRLLKVLALDSGFPSGLVQAMRDYKTKAPGGKVVVRVYSPKNYSLANDPTASALDFWNTILQPPLNGIAASDRALIDYLEGPNEGQTPALGYPINPPGQASQWFNQFWTNLTPLIVSAGYKPCIGSIAVGDRKSTRLNSSH